MFSVVEKLGDKNFTYRGTRYVSFGVRSHGSEHDHHDPLTSLLSAFDQNSLPVDGDSVSQLHFGSFRRGCYSPAAIKIGMMAAGE